MSAPAIPNFDEWSQKQAAKIPNFDTEFQQPEAPAKPQNLLQRAQQFGQDHPTISGIASLLVPGASAVLDPTQETGKGALKQVGRDAYGLATGPGLGPIGMAAGYLGNKTGLTDRIMKATEPANDRQQVGAYGTTAAEMALPLPGAIKGLEEAFPSTEALGQNFQRINSAVGKQPVDVSKFSQPALDARHLNRITGDTNPTVLRKAFDAIQPTTNPLTFEDSRLLQSSAGRKAVQMNEAPRVVSKPMFGHVSQLAKGLGEANSEVAAQGGVGPLYESTMKAYARRQALETAGRGLKKAAIPVAIGAAGAGTAAPIIKSLFFGQ